MTDTHIKPSTDLKRLNRPGTGGAWCRRVEWWLDRLAEAAQSMSAPGESQLDEWYGAINNPKPAGFAEKIGKLADSLPIDHEADREIGRFMSSIEGDTEPLDEPEERGAQRRVACAAIKHRVTGETICGPRHVHCFQKLEREDDVTQYAQGFVDQDLNFLSRAEAMVVARDAGQIPVGLPGTGLCSECLYGECDEDVPRDPQERGDGDALGLDEALDLLRAIRRIPGENKSLELVESIIESERARNAEEWANAQKFAQDSENRIAELTEELAKYKEVIAMIDGAANGDSVGLLTRAEKAEAEAAELRRKVEALEGAMGDIPPERLQVRGYANREYTLLLSRRDLENLNRLAERAETTDFHLSIAVLNQIAQMLDGRKLEPSKPEGREEKMSESDEEMSRRIGEKFSGLFGKPGANGMTRYGFSTDVYDTIEETIAEWDWLNVGRLADKIMFAVDGPWSSDMPCGDCFGFAARKDVNDPNVLHVQYLVNGREIDCGLPRRIVR